MLLMTGLLSLLACGVGDSHPSQVTDTRVIAAIAEPPEPAAGEVVVLQVYVADPQQRGVELLVWSCTPYGDADCIELDAGVQAMVAVVDEQVGERFVVARPIPREVEALAQATNEADELSATLWLLACEPGVCDIIDDAREVLARPGDRRAAEELAEDLADPTPWLRELPLDGVNLAARPVPLGSGENRNINPAVETRFVTEDEAGQPVTAQQGEAKSLRFSVHDANGTRTDAHAYTTIGRFDDDEVREDKEDDSVVHWLLAPEKAGTGRLWVVFDDRDGGRAVWTSDAVIE